MTLHHFFSPFRAELEQTLEICIKHLGPDMMNGSGLRFLGFVFFLYLSKPSHCGAPCVYLLSLPSDKLQLTSPAVPFLPEGGRLCLRPYFLLFLSFFPRVKLLCSLLNEGTAALMCCYKLAPWRQMVTGRRPVVMPFAKATPFDLRATKVTTHVVSLANSNPSQSPT